MQMNKRKKLEIFKIIINRSIDSKLLVRIQLYAWMMSRKIHAGASI